MNGLKKRSGQREREGRGGKEEFLEGEMSLLSYLSVYSTKHSHREQLSPK